MKKLLYIGIGFIWLVIFALVMFTVLSSPDKELVKVLYAYKQVNKAYLDQKQIEPAKLFDHDDLSQDEEFVKIYANFVMAWQKAEAEYSAQKNITMVVLEPQNLMNPAIAASAPEKWAALNAVTVKVYQDLVQAEKASIAAWEALDVKKMQIFDPKLATEDFLPKYNKAREDISSNRLGIEKYGKAITDFAAQKSGQMSAEGGFVKFLRPEDQKYYNDILTTIRQFERSSSYIIEQNNAEIRGVNEQIPIIENDE